MSLPDYYRALKVHRDASEGEIKASFRVLGAWVVGFASSAAHAHPPALLQPSKCTLT